MCIKALLIISTLFAFLCGLAQSAHDPLLTQERFMDEELTCETFTDPEDCLRYGNRWINCGWCSDANDSSKGMCMAGTKIGPDSQDAPAYCMPFKSLIKGVLKDIPSPLWEHHDLVFSGTTVCTTITPNKGATVKEIDAAEAKCISGANQSTCSWCPSAIEAFRGTDDDGDLKERRPRCIFRFENEESVVSSCQYIPDIFVQCSTFRTCSGCAELGKGMCMWCPGESSCIQDVKSSEYEEYYDATKMLEVCPAIGAEDDEPGFDSSCCDEYATGANQCGSCEEHWGSINQRQCMWSFEKKACVKAPVNKNKELPTFEEIEDVCPNCNYFGSEYCLDECYALSKSCDKCVSNSACVWISEAKFSSTNSNSGGGTLEQHNFCFKGSMTGPKKKTIIMYPQFTFEMKQFYFLTCSMTATTLLNVIVGVCVAAVLLAIIIFIVVKFIKRAKYANMIKKAKNTFGIGNIEPEEENNEDKDDFVLQLQTVPWTDDVETAISAIDEAESEVIDNEESNEEDNLVEKKENDY